MKSKCLPILIAVLLCLGGIAEAPAITIDFESLSDSQVVTNQFLGLGVTFQHATAITAGISLNEFEFPPFSGVNVVFDDGGPVLTTRS